MQKIGSEKPDVKPLLFRHATPRISSSDLPGHYNANNKVWVIETPSGWVPVVEAGTSPLFDTSTTTRVREEADDDDASLTQEAYCMLLDTSTVTKVRPESDDNDLSCEATVHSLNLPANLAELLTKTDVQQESDDDLLASGMVELETRSFNNQEGVDEDDWPRELLELLTKTSTIVEQDDESFVGH